MSIRLSSTDVLVCEACWRGPVTAVRHTVHGRDRLCRACAEGGCPRRVDVFPPYGIYRLHHVGTSTQPTNKGDER
ncbi:hypothetical protein ABZ763_19150 [Streptomyces bacillaris]|uniref:hypothetical protein n=1 Tax=Streptomyces sp. ZL-24 TaxID=1933029 RepID=UPI001F4DF9DC|nr:hypothetical protein [Streptomyces sp. ZL-24]